MSSKIKAIFVLVFFFLLFLYFKSVHNLEVLQPSSNSAGSTFEYVDSKRERVDSHYNKMDLYTWSEDFVKEDLLRLCKMEKKKFKSGMFYHLVVFNNSSQAVFPENPFTAMFGLQYEVMKHIKAYYVFNRINGFSKLRIYEDNMFESLPEIVEI